MNTGSISVNVGDVRYIGRRNEDDVAEFAGIPFAKPPIGARRLRPPEPLHPSDETVEALEFRAAPMQAGPPQLAETPASVFDEKGRLVTPPTTMPELLAALHHLPLATSEDCLYLNVWTPSLHGRRPVIVWIYGGGFEGGTATPPGTDGAALSRLTDCVVVSIPYRVGALGFGYWAGIGGEEWLASSNLGPQDQLAALRWVRENIGGFGGAPDNITVAGESAGAFSIGSLLAMPPGVSCFDRAILHSGSAGRVYPVETAHAIACDLLDHLGVTTIADFLEQDAEAIVTAQRTVIAGDIGDRNLPGGRAWGVVLDGLILAEDPLAAVRSGRVSHIPLLIGANRDETRAFRPPSGRPFRPTGASDLRTEMAKIPGIDPGTVLDAYRRKAERDKKPADLVALRSEFLTDAIYRRPASDLATAQANAGGNAWSYLFSATPIGDEVGASHGLDQIYVFDALAMLALDSAENIAVRDELIEAWSSFARYGEPGWARYVPNTPGLTRQFGAEPPFVTEPPADELATAWPVALD